MRAADQQVGPAIPRRAGSDGNNAPNNVTWKDAPYAAKVAFHLGWRDIMEPGWR
jgi:hypothetical protein